MVVHVSIKGWLHDHSHVHRIPIPKSDVGRTNPKLCVGLTV